MAQIQHSCIADGKLQQCMVAAIVNILGISFGIICGWPSPLLPQLRRSETPMGDAPMSAEAASWINGLMIFGNFTIGPFSGTLIERFGRKAFGYAACLPILLSWLVAFFATSHVYLFVSRFLAGIGGAMYFILVPIYVGEISSDEVRGALGSLANFSMKFGILLAYVAGTYLSYKLFIIFSMTFPCIFLLAFSFLPETPVYLLKRNRLTEATSSLMFFRGNNKILVDELLSKLQSQINDFNQSVGKVSFLELFKDRATFKGLVIVSGLLSCQQFSGNFAVFTYAHTIFQLSGSSLSPEYASMIIGLIYVLGSFLPIILIDRVGRRPLALISCAGMAVCHFIFGTFCYLSKFGQEVSAIGWLPVVALSLYVVAYCVGVGPIPYVLASEIFRVNVTSYAYTFCIFFLWIMAFVVIKSFGPLMENIGIENCFLLLGTFCTAGFLFSYFILPETKGKKREEIVADLEGNDNKSPGDSCNDNTVCVETIRDSI